MNSKAPSSPQSKGNGTGKSVAELLRAIRSTSGGPIPSLGAESGGVSQAQGVGHQHPALIEYDHISWPAHYTFRKLIKSAPIPSPFSPSIAEWEGVIGCSPLKNIRPLYQVTQCSRLILENEASKHRTDFTEDCRRSRLLCWLEKLAPDAKDDLNYIWVEGDEALSFLMGDVIERYILKDSDDPDSLPNLVSIHGLKKSLFFNRTGAEEFDHFFVNHNLGSITINGIPIARGMVAGPLPSFAVIQTGNSFLLWWGASEGLQYTPPKQQPNKSGTKRSLEEFQEFENLNDNLVAPKKSKNNATNTLLSSLTIDDKSLDSTQLFNVNTTQPQAVNVTATQPQAVNASGQPSGSDWCLDYERRLKNCISQVSPDDGSSSSPAHQLSSFSGLNLNDVVLAIASLWLGLDKQGIYFAFGNADFISEASKERVHSTFCVRPGETFIFPLVFDAATKALSPETEKNVEPAPSLTFKQFWQTTVSNTPKNQQQQANTSQDDHTVLVIARTLGYNHVSLTFFDNDEGKHSQDLIRRAARNVVRNSAWLLDKWPNFSNEDWRTPPRQTGDTSGLHTVLNAWAFMLRVPLEKKKDVVVKPDFYAEALKLINLSLKGKLDGFTIRAFLMCYNYAAYEDLATVMSRESVSSQSQRPVLYTRTSLTSKTAFETILAKISALDEKPGAVLSQNPPLQTGVSWRSSLADNLARFRRQRQNAGFSSVTIPRTINLADEDIALAVASVWEGLRLAGIEFAYGTADSFRFNRDVQTQVAGTGPVLQPNPLVMPLLFVNEYTQQPSRGTKKAAHNAIGHFVLAVAERPSKTSQDVTLIYMDSLPGSVGEDTQRRVAQNLVRYSGWMGIDGQGNALPSAPTFTEVNRPVPVQEGGNTCGLFVILNAWAYMLGIPIAPHKRRLVAGMTTKVFTTAALEMVNLALAGCMNSPTIQAFLNVFGYSEEQDINNHAVAVIPVDTVPMTMTTLETIVQNCRAVEQTIAATAPTPTPPPPANADVAALMALGFTDVDARDALRLTNGDLNQASLILLARVP